MKSIISLSIIFFAATMFGCKDSNQPKTEVRVESASEAARNDSRDIAKRLAEQKADVDAKFSQERARELRQRNVDALRAVSSRWDEVMSEAGRTGRSDIAGPLKKMQAIKSDANTVETDDCTSGARATLQSAMAASIEAFNMFQKETGPSGDATTQKLQQGADLARNAQQEMAACLTK